MYFHLISSLTPCGNTVQLRVRVRRLASEGEEVHIFTFQPVPPLIRKSFEGIARIHELNTHFVFEPFWRILFTARKFHLKPREIHVWGTELLATGLRLAEYYNVCSSATLRHQDAFTTRLPILRRFTRIEANSSTLLQAAVQAGNRGNWQVVYDELDASPNVATNPTTKTREEFLEELELPADSILIACIGPVSRWKRWQWAIWSIDSIVRVHPNFRLLFFDPDLANPQVRHLNPLDERERHNISDFIHQYERENIVRFLPFHDDYYEILPFINILWLPQTTPGSGLAALEAQAAGVSIIAHRNALDVNLFPNGTFTALPEDSVSISLASTTHNFWNNL